MTITPKQVDWLLYNLPALRQMVETMEPRTSTSIVELGVSGGAGGNPVEDMAIRRAEISVVVGAVRGGLRQLDREHWRLYRLKYRRRLSRERVCRILSISARTYDRKLAHVRTVISQRVAAKNGALMNRFWAAIRLT